MYLDLEPHALRAEHSACLYHWDQLKASQKRGLMYGLLSAVIQTHRILKSIPSTKRVDTSGRQTVTPQLLVYLPAWLDHTHTPDRIWESPSQRDEFYRCLRHYTDEVTVAAYCRSGIDRIYQSVYQEAALLHQHLRIGFNVYHRVGSDEACKTWSHLDEVLHTSEMLKHRLYRMTKIDVGFDFENLTRLIDEIHTQSNEK